MRAGHFGLSLRVEVWAGRYTAAYRGAAAALCRAGRLRRDVGGEWPEAGREELGEAGITRVRVVGVTTRVALLWDVQAAYMSMSVLGLVWPGEDGPGRARSTRADWSLPAGREGGNLWNAGINMYTGEIQENQ